MANTDNINECMTNDSLNGKSSSGESLKFVKKLYIHGGNISNWNRIKRKTTPSSADEVSLIIDVSGNNITWLRKRQVINYSSSCCKKAFFHLSKA